MNALVPVVVSLTGVVVGALVAGFGVVRALRQVRQSAKTESASSSPGPEASPGPQVLVTVTTEETPGQPHSEVVVYTVSGKAEHYAVAEPAASVAMKMEAAAQHALQGEPTRVETAKAPRVH